MDLDVEGERLGVERARDRGVELAGASVDAAVDMGGGQRACDRPGEDEVLGGAAGGGAAAERATPVHQKQGDREQEPTHRAHSDGGGSQHTL